MAYVESGNTASRTYAAGDFISWKGTLYKASTAIPATTAFAVGSNLTAVVDGGLNNLNSSLSASISNITEVKTTLTSSVATIVVAKKSRIGHIASYIIRLDFTSSVSNGGTILSGLDIPADAVYGAVNTITNNGHHFLMDSSGNVISEQAISSGVSERFSFTDVT
jgi:hypothetical protein